MDFSQKNRRGVGLLLLSLLFVAGCDNLSNQSASSISDYSWRLVELRQGDSIVWRGVSDGSGAPTLVFADRDRGAVSGWTGQNPFDGHYSLIDSEIQINIEALGLNPAGDSLSIQNRFVKFMRSPSTIFITYDTLILTQPNGTRAKFSRVSEN